jgi:DNA topoisomerase-3
VTQEEIAALINRGPAEADTPSEPDEQAIHCPKCRAPMIQRDGKFGAFFACSRYPRCKGTRPLEDSQPEDGTSQKPTPCPHCFSPLVRRHSKKGWFWGCSNFPACRQTLNDDNGKPALNSQQ